MPELGARVAAKVWPLKEQIFCHLGKHFLPFKKIFFLSWPMFFKKLEAFGDQTKKVFLKWQKSFPKWQQICGNIATHVWLLCPGPGGPFGALRVRCPGDVYVARQGLKGDGHLGFVHGDHLVIG